MRFRLGLLIGLGAGYWFGTKAGRERYEQLHAMVERAKASETYESATEKAKAVVDLSVERARDLVGEHGSDPDTGDDGIVVVTGTPGTTTQL